MSRSIRLWARLAESGTPFVLHVAARRFNSPRPGRTTVARRRRIGFGGGENVRSRILPYYTRVRNLLSMMAGRRRLRALSKLHGASVELGAGWYPSCWCGSTGSPNIGQGGQESRNLLAQAFRATDAQMAFTPFVSRTSARSSINRTRICICSRPTIRTSRADEIRSRASRRHWASAVKSCATNSIREFSARLSRGSGA